MIGVLTEQTEHKKTQSYWITLKNRLKEEGSEVVTKCHQLKIEASDGKKPKSSKECNYCKYVEESA